MTDTAEYLACLLILLGLAAVVIAVLTDRLIEHWRDADLQDRINRARWPSKE